MARRRPPPQVRARRARARQELLFSRAGRAPQPARRTTSCSSTSWRTASTDDTWIHHLRQHDYSSWFRDAIKDDELAEEAREIERREQSPARAGFGIRKAIGRR
jgi:hypothetical protein